MTCDNNVNPIAHNDSPNLKAALDYAKKGWAVFPVHSAATGGACTCRKGAACSRPGKHPRTPHGLKDATKDPDTIQSWWTMWPDANIGIATGAVSGIVVIDIDVDKGGLQSLATVQEALGALPPTLMAKSGSGGKHYYYTWPGQKVPTRTNHPAKGIDIRGDGGYIIAPPSNHRSGGRYEWL